MMRALNTSATGMVAQQYNLDVISNNLANVNTTGFKAQRAEFQDLMYQTMKMAGTTASGSSSSPVSLQVGLGSQFSSESTNFAQGPMQATGNPLDLAVSGNGFFRVLKPDGAFAYTRDGSFKIDSTGLVVNSDGLPLDPPITIPSGASAINVSTDGVVSYTAANSSDTTKLGTQISLTMFANPAGMQRVGQNLYLANTASGDPVNGNPGQNGSGELRPGFVEGSNVQVVDEMTRMIMAQRAYEINSKAIQTSDEMLSTLNGLKR